MKQLFIPKRTLVRARTLDHATVDAAIKAYQPFNERGDARGKTFDRAIAVRGKTYDSTGAFLVGELERLDQTLHMPLAAVSWSRDIDLREDVSIADEHSSFTLTTFASGGGLGAGNGGSNGADRTGKAWIGKNTNQIGGVDVDTSKAVNPLRPWSLELRFDILELESAAQMGRPIDAQKLEALKLKHQMDVDEQVYVGDGATGDKGLFNSAAVTNVSNVPNGAASSPLWANKTPDEILADVNNALVDTWTKSGFAVMPNRILIPPVQFGYISTIKVSSAGNISILKYLLENNILKTSGKGELTILPAKWLVGAGVGGTLGTAGTVDRMVVYTKEKQYVRYPMTMLQRTPVQYVSIYHLTTYYCKLGVVEVVYPETISYRDGL